MNRIATEVVINTESDLRARIERCDVDMGYAAALLNLGIKSEYLLHLYYGSRRLKFWLRSKLAKGKHNK